MNKKNCPKCGYQNVSVAWNCAKCGSTLSMRDTVADFKGAVEIINRQYRSNVLQLRKSHEEKLAKAKRDLQEIAARLGLSAAAWSEPDWDRFEPTLNSQVPVGVRVGTTVFRGSAGELQAATLVPFLNQGNLFFVAKGAAKEKAAKALQAVVLRMVATFPPGKLKLILVDPAGLGANVAGLLSLPEQVIGSKAWTESRQIEQQLTDLSAHLETVIQKYLLLDFATMEEYNLKVGEVAEPYRILSVINFPANFDDASAKKLVSIADNGPRSGVYTICTIDGDRSLPHEFNLEDLLRTGTVIASEGGEEFSWQSPGLDKAPIILDNPPDSALFNRIVKSVGKLAEAGAKVEVPFGKVAVRRENWWNGTARRSIEASLGAEGASFQIFSLGEETQQHALLAGRTGSGKTNLVHVLITNLCLYYSPDELVLYLIDFKEGVEFKDYAVAKLPHARVIGIESEREFGLSVLRELEREMDRRGKLLRRANCVDLTKYRQQTGEPLPRILLIVDEFQRLFSEDDRLSDEAARIVAHIAQQGRAFGVHLFLAAQTLADAYTVRRQTYDQMNIRIALQCTEADSRLILGEDNRGARLLTRPGAAIYNDQNGLEERNKLFQVAVLPPEKRKDYLAKIAELADRNPHMARIPQVIFEGNRVSHLFSNTVLKSTIMADKWPEATKAVSVFLGESTEISPPHTTVTIRPQTAANMVVVGQNEKVAYSLLSTILVSLGALLRPDESKFYVADFSRVDDPWVDTFSRLVAALPHEASLAGRREFANTVYEVEQLVNQRIQAGDAAQKERVFVFIAGIQRARDLRETDKYGSPIGAANALAHICREGPDLGVHVITWCDTLGNLSRVMERRTILEFDLRVAMQMGDDDSMQLIESPKAKSLGPYRAYLYDMENPETLEKFRPYELISDGELQALQTAFSNKR